MGALKSVGLDDIERRGSIRDTDVARLRSAFYNDGHIAPEEAEALFRLDQACSDKADGWADFFVEALTDYVVNQADPVGYVTAENASWLIERIGHDGRLETRTELELLVNVLDKARWSPVGLVRFALDQVKQAVLHGDGALRAGASLEPGTIGEAEVELLRRMLYSFGGDGNVAITRAEAEVLFEINDIVADAPANPAWTDLFVKAVANVLMAASGYAVPTREEALRREAWLDSRGDLSLGSVLGGFVSDALGAVWGGYREQSAEERALARLERQRIEIVTNEHITEGEVAWLAERIGRDGRLTANESALIAYLRQESPKIDPALGELVARLSRAA